MKIKLLLVVALLLALTACIDPAVFFPPTPTPTPSPTPIISPTPTPIPSITPLPSILPTPPPAATPTPTPEVPLCNLPPSSAPQSACHDITTEISIFRNDVLEAQQDAANRGFVVNDKIVNQEEYTAFVAKVLRNKGYCATSVGLADEVWVKNSNIFSEHFDIVTSDLHPWNKYAARCSPAKF